MLERNVSPDTNFFLVQSLRCLILSSRIKIRSFENTNSQATSQSLLCLPRHPIVVMVGAEGGAGVGAEEDGVAVVVDREEMGLQGRGLGRTRTRQIEEIIIGRGDMIRRWLGVEALPYDRCSVEIQMLSRQVSLDTHVSADNILRSALYYERYSRFTWILRI